MEYWNLVILAGTALLLVSIVASHISSRMGAPLLLVFLLLGMLAGEDGPGGIRFDDFEVAYLVGTLALAVIIFDGGLRTRRETFRVGLGPAVSLATAGVVITAALVGLLAAAVLGVTLLEGLLLGAIIGSTDAAAVFATLRTQGAALKERVAATLEIESGSNDPMAVFLTIGLLELIAAGRPSVDASLALSFLRQFSIGAVLGLAGGRLLVWLINRLTLVTGLYPLLAAAGGVLIYAGTATVGGSGFLAIYLAGVVVGNSQLQAAQNILRVHDGLAWLSQIAMFLILGLLITPSQLVDVAWPALAIAFFLMLAARPVAVALSLLPFRFPWREQVYIGWVGLRGAVPIVLALFPMMYGIENARLYFNVAFFVVLVSLLVQGWSVSTTARWLGLELPPPIEPAQRVTLDVPGHYEHEMISFRVDSGSMVAGRDLGEFRLPETARIMTVLRNGIPVADHGIRLAEGDYVCLLARPKDVQHLGQLFNPHTAPAHLEVQRYFGDFTLNGDALVGDLASVYGLAVSPQIAQISLEQYLSRTFHGRASIGDTVTMGAAKLVVREMQDGKVTGVGLRLPLPSPDNEQSGSAQN
ncbi:MAG: K+/H+ antiporter [Betaproteobacteria bacterium RIFCSPLOWO2_12_FULL_66_14]|nr:MAG: K+/H+ antiporter [Betaproteobacteria bacterium RIFCSPLOWO2_12_FULL_66_14]